jgi:hypothetical protein
MMHEALIIHLILIIRVALLLQYEFFFLATILTVSVKAEET